MNYICEYCGGQGMMVIQPLTSGPAFNRMCPQCRGTGSPLDAVREQAKMEDRTEHNTYVIDKVLASIEKFQRKHIERNGLK